MDRSPSPARPSKSVSRRLALRLLRVALRTLLVAAIVAQTLYLARRPLLEGVLRDQAAAALAAALDADVTIGAIGGSWLTDLIVSDLAIENGRGAVRRLVARDVRVHLAPLDLVRGDLGGVARVSADLAVLDIDTGASSDAAPTDTEPAGPPELGPLAALLPHGAHIAIDALTLRGATGTVAGPATVAIAAHAPGTPLVLSARVPGSEVDAELDGSGRIVAAVHVQDPFVWARAFADLPGFEAGTLSTRAELRLLPELAVTASVRAAGIRYRDHRIDLLAASAVLDPRAVRVPELAVQATGIDVALRDFALPLGSEAPLAALRASVRVAVDDAAGYRDLLPAGLADQLPIRARLLLEARDGVLRIEPSRVSTAAVTLDLTRGALPLAAGDLRSGSLDLRGALVDGERLGLPADAALRPASGSFVATIAARDGGFEGTCELDAVVRARDDRSAVVRGRLPWRHDGVLHVEPSLAVEGDLLRRVERVDLEARASLDGSALTVEELTVKPGTGGIARARGRSDLAADGTAALLSASELDLRFDDVDVARLCSLLELPYTGNAALALRWNGASPDRLALRADATIGGLLRDASVPTRIELRALQDAAGARLADLLVENPALRIAGSATTDGLDVVALLADPDAASRPVAGRLDLFADDLAALALAPFWDGALAGRLDGDVVLAGSLAAPEPTAELQLDGVAVRDANAVLVEQVSGRLRVGPNGIEARELSAVARGVGASLDGRARSRDDTLELDGITLRLGQDGGVVRVNGRLATSRGLLAALRSDSALDVEIEALDLAALAPLLSDGQRAGGPWLRGRIDGRVAWQADGTPSAAATLSGELLGLLQGEAPLSIELSAGGDDRGVGIDRIVLGHRGARAEGRARFTEASLDALLSGELRLADAPIDVELDCAGLDLAWLDPTLLGMTDLGGRVDAHATCRGTPEAPLPRLDLRIADAFVRPRGATRVSAITGHVEVTPDAVRLDALRAELGAGPVTVDGTFTTPGPLHEHWRTGTCDLRVVGDDVLLYRGGGVKARADLDLTARGPLHAIEVRGKLALDSSKFVSRIPFVTLDSAGGRAVEPGITIPGVDLGPAVKANLDVDVTTDSPFEVKTNLFTGGLALALKLRGPLSAPALEGTISGVDGTVSLPGCRFRASTLLLRFEREDPRFPNLTLIANGRRHGFDVLLNARGPYHEPEVLLSSNPPLPVEELAVLVATGARPASLQQQGARGAATLVGSYLLEEIADYLFGSESTEAKESFLERLTIETGTEISASGTESIVVEFRVFDRLYLQGERDVYEDVNLGVVWRVRFR